MKQASLLPVKCLRLALVFFGEGALGDLIPFLTLPPKGDQIPFNSQMNGIHALLLDKAI